MALIVALPWVIQNQLVNNSTHPVAHNTCRGCFYEFLTDACVLVRGLQNLQAEKLMGGPIRQLEILAPSEIGLSQLIELLILPSGANNQRGRNRVRTDRQIQSVHHVDIDP